LKLSHLLFEKNYNEFSLADLKFLKKFINYRLVEKVNLEEDLVFLKIANSKSESRRLIDQKGIKVFFLLDKFFLIKKGKNEFGLIEINKK
jgi:tyrosyl-tRNA synthetase